MLLTRDMRLVLYRSFSDVVGKGVFFAITLVAARRLTGDDFGLFAVATTTGWIAAVAADFGVQLHLARLVAQRPAESAATLRTWLGVRIWTAAAALAVVVSGLLFWSPRGEVVAAVAAFTLMYALGGLIEFLHYFYRGLSRSDIESTLTLWLRLSTLLMAGLALTWRPNLVVLGVAMAVPAFAVFLYSRHLALALAPAVAGARAASGRDTVLAALPNILPIGAGIVLSALYFRIDVFLLDLWSGPSAVGQYNAVFRLVEALRLFPAAVLAVALPSLFRASTSQPLLRLSAGLAGGATVASLVLWMAADGLIPLLYGERYNSAIPAFRILLLGFPLMALNYALTHQVIGWYGHRAYAATCALALVFNVGLNARLIPSSGIAGAAWTTVWTEGVLTVGCLIAIIRTTASGRVARLVAPAPSGASAES